MRRKQILQFLHNMHRNIPFLQYKGPFLALFTGICSLQLTNRNTFFPLKGVEYVLFLTSIRNREERKLTKRCTETGVGRLLGKLSVRNRKKGRTPPPTRRQSNRTIIQHNTYNIKSQFSIISSIYYGSYLKRYCPSTSLKFTKIQHVLKKVSAINT